MPPKAQGTVYKGFAFPPFYDLPPFFTSQPVHNTRQTQMHMWGELILSFTRFFKIYELDIAEATATSPLFRNDTINRSLDAEAAKKYVEFLIDGGNAEWMDNTKTRAFIYWRKPSEWASIVHTWALDRGKIGEVLTLYDLQEGEDSEGRDFFRLPTPIFLKALDWLQKQKKAIVFNSENSEAIGVKFFA